MSERWRGRIVFFLLCLTGSFVYLIVGVSLGLFDEVRFIITVVLLLVVSATVALTAKDPARWAGEPRDEGR